MTVSTILAPRAAELRLRCAVCGMLAKCDPGDPVSTTDDFVIERGGSAAIYRHARCPRRMTSVEVHAKAGGDWVSVGSVSEAECPGSISAWIKGRRQVLVFGWLADDLRPGVWRSAAGFDLDNSAVRMVVSEQMVRLSDLREPFEIDTEGTDELRMSMRIRFTRVETP